MPHRSGSVARPLADTMVVFGWNGTLVVDADPMRAALNAVLDARGLPAVGEDEFALRFRLPLRRLFAELGLAPLEAVEAESEWAVALSEVCSRLRPGAAAALRELSGAGCWLGVVTTASAASLRHDLRALQVPSVFQAVVPAVVDRYQSLVDLRAARAQAVLVGDTTDEMRCASAAGYTAVGLASTAEGGEALRCAGAVEVVGDLGALRGIVERLPASLV